MAKTTITPRGKQILVLQDEEKSRLNEHGLVLPAVEEQERKAIGTVISVGPDITDVKKGNRVIFAAFAGEKLKVKEGQKEVDYVLLYDEDVLAFIND